MTINTDATFILNKIFSIGHTGKFTLATASQAGGFIAITGSGSIRWIVPGTEKFGRKVLSQWKPYGMTSLAKWHVLRLLYRLGVLIKVPGISEVFMTMPSKKYKKNETLVVPVIYVGTPGAQQKAVITLIEINSGNPVAVMKVALADGAIASIITEASMLKRLLSKGVDDVPRLIGINQENGVSLQTVVSGKLANGNMDIAMLNSLLGMFKTEITTTLDEQKIKLDPFVTNRIHDFNSRQQELIKRALSLLGGSDSIPMPLVHGDFAPWNIKQISRDKCALIDWEDGEECGLPMWDICHFNFIQACLFNKPINKQNCKIIYGKASHKQGQRYTACIALYTFYSCY